LVSFSWSHAGGMPVQHIEEQATDQRTVLYGYLYNVARKANIRRAYT